ncbi:HutD family protein [Erwinia pyrifoliae]|uniref:HutD family protein n=1 Tax=Erwinia pyrifoliae TaxID=79967 RepID=A0ABY5X4J8_ERWPY|nr:HutD family protein [Erwinia pyrifoliae]AUX72200.1 HutD-family protein [Erwinia pyrifoliae]MCA8877560.1 HutD family protein [Erwinia pyrifoliae]MCT2388451.1 HutD family protein [Erwinia pyrifoliae]MCU8586620.1 HutD family protein [Erwinia pyrifoliae]UWS30510.1 HutD family protein [Erwinia pyrifoliae]
MIHPYDSRTLPVSRWRNGGGETREIISFPAGVEDFDWRISIATIAADGDFSLFPGVDRIITLLNGGVALYRKDRLYQRLVLNQPFAFAGEESIKARIIGNSSSDFNIMVRRDRFRALAGVSHQPLTPVTTGGVAYVISGRWQHGETRLSAGQGAWWQHDAETFVPLCADAQLLWATIVPR